MQFIIGGSRGPEISQPGAVEGVPVNDIILDTVSARTIVRSDLVPAENKAGVRYQFAVPIATQLSTP